MADCIPPQGPPDYTKMTRTVAEVAHTLNKGRQLGGFWKNLSGGKLQQRGEAYMDGSRILIEQCRPLMDPDDEDTVVVRYHVAQDAMATLDVSGLSGFRRIKEARTTKALCKKAYRTAKKASDRVLDNNVVGPSGRMDPPSEPSPTTPEESSGTDPSDGASPGTPEEPDGSPPHDSFTDSHAAATSSIDESIEDLETTLPSGAAGIGVPVDRDDASETYSSFYDPDLAASETSIASYKTEKTVNSRKSRYNVLPRHKYADHGCIRPQGPRSLGDTSVPKTELRDEHIDDDDESPSSPQSAPPTSPGPSSGTQPLDEPDNTEPIHGDTPSQPLTPHRGVAFLTAILTGLMSGVQAREVGDVDLFGFDSKVYAD